MEGTVGKMKGAPPPAQLLTNKQLVATICEGWYHTTAKAFDGFRTGNGGCTCECPTREMYNYTLPADDGQLGRAKKIIDEARDKINSIPPALLTVAGPDAFFNARSFIQMLSDYH